MVENQELVIGTNADGLRDQIKYDHVNESATKGKRTKRQRPPSPLALTMAMGSGSTSSSGGGVGSSENLPFGGHDHHPTVSPKCSSSSSINLVQNIREEEEDMANCLILLAQGRQPNKQVKRANSAQESNDTTTSNKNTAVSCDSYQCKTCNRSFPSFQALGGHRASHKKLPKINTSDPHKKFLSLNLMGNCISEHDNFNAITSTSLSLQIPSNGDVSSSGKTKIHECSICGAEFSSGQALGGHMRRHRPMVPAGNSSTTTIVVPQSIDGGQQHEEAYKRPKTMLQLDLNLPAPEDRESMYAFGPREQVLVFSSSPWVDCHY